MFILSVLLPLVGSTAATSTLSIEPLTIGAGETKTMLIDLNNPDQQVTMVEFHMQLPQGLSVAAGDNAIDIAGRTNWQKHTLYMNTQDGMTHIMLASPTNALVSGTSGAIISIKLTAASTFSGGTIILKNQKIGSPDMTVSKPADYSYTVETSTPQPEGQPYVVLNNGTLTFYCDNQRSSRQGTTYDLNTGYNRPGWLANQESVTKAVFDASFSNARPTSTHCWFNGCKNLMEIQGISYLNTESVTDMSYMLGPSSVKTLDVSNFNTANVTDMSGMFNGCNGLTTLDVSNFNTENVTSMGSMFSGCTNLTSLDVSNFNTENVKYISYMFNGCSSLTTLDVSNFNTANVTGLREMFSICSKLTKLTLGSKFSTKEELECENVFSGCNSLKTVAFTGDIPSSIHSKFFTGVGTASSPATLDVPEQYREHYAAKFNGNMFFGGYFTLGGDNPQPDAEPYVVYNNGTLTFYYDNQRSSRQGTTYDLNTGSNRPGWYDNSESITKAVFDASFANARPTTTYYWFRNCKNLTEIQGISYLNTENVTNMGYMFYYCSSLTTLDVSKNVTNMGYMFYYCSSLTTLDVSKFNTANVTNMGYMFRDCSSLTTLDVSNFNTANVTSIGSMFYGCSSLTNLDVSKFNTANVTEIGGMFYGCSSLTSLDVSNFDTANVTSMYLMFSDCSSLTTLDVSKFNTGNVTDMSRMFYNCSGLTTLDVSNFNTAKVTNMEIMFYNCSRLTTLDVSNFNTEKVTYMGSMFSGCSSLTNLDVSNFNTANVNSTYQMFRGCNCLTTLDLSNFNTEKVVYPSGMFYGCSKLAKLTFGSKFSTREEWECENVFYNCGSLKTVAFTGNIPSSIQVLHGCGHGKQPCYARRARAVPRQLCSKVQRWEILWRLLYTARCRNQRYLYCSDKRGCDDDVQDPQRE